MLRADVAVEQLVLLTDVFTEQLEFGKILFITSWTFVVKKIEECLLHLCVREANTVLFIVQTRAVFDVQLLIGH